MSVLSWITVCKTKCHMVMLKLYYMLLLFLDCFIILNHPLKYTLILEVDDLQAGHLCFDCVSRQLQVITHSLYKNASINRIVVTQTLTCV